MSFVIFLRRCSYAKGLSLEFIESESKQSRKQTEFTSRNHFFHSDQQEVPIRILSLQMEFYRMDNFLNVDGKKKKTHKLTKKNGIQMGKKKKLKNWYTPAEAA